MKYLFLAVILAVALIGVHSPAHAAHADQSTVEEQLTEPLNSGDVQTKEEIQGMNAPNVSRPEMSGEMYYDTYDENTGFPDVTESDRMGEVGID